MAFLPFLHRAAARENLSRDEARRAMALILDGAATTAQIAAFLVALKMKGETAEEVSGFASAMRERSETVDAGLNGEPFIDTCGTGGGALRTFNISTVAAFVVAGAGVRVAKHGNRSMTSQCGSADILEALGIDLRLAPVQIGRAIREIGIGFLFAPAHHPAMRHAQPARAELKMTTVFNLLGPLTNPARAPRQLIGASSPEAAALIAGALYELGTDRTFVVHGLDGLDEVSTIGATLAYEATRSKLEKQLWTPADFGLAPASAADLEGGDRDRNCGMARRILEGEKSARRDIVMANAAAALVAAGRASSLREGAALAAESIDSGAAGRKVEELAAYSRAASG